MAGLALVLVSMQVASVRGQSAKYPPLSEYMMTPEAEIALALHQMMHRGNVTDARRAAGRAALATQASL